jgi:TRAP-type C4-dicarboxylate transport system permease small subunit
VLRIETAVRSLASYVAVLGLLLLLILAVLTLFDGLSRAFANYPLNLVREIGDLVAAFAGTCCLPIVLLERGNIVLRILDGVLPMSLVRVIDLINAILISIVLAGMAIQFWLYSFKTMKAGEITWLLNIPKAPFWFAVDGVLWVAVAIQLFLLAQATTSLRNAQS